ncbi:hypothetical protein J14TS5_03710 [Paenibacillus lautus]|nr:hypothetical protein J14TS5_03710 [Paenibacillus lautus]
MSFFACPKSKEEKENGKASTGKGRFNCTGGSEAIVEEVRDYCQKARQLREQADELRRSGSTVATEISKLLEQADYYNHLADQKDGHPRLELLRAA